MADSVGRGRHAGGGGGGVAARNQYYVGILLHGGLFMSRSCYLYLGRSLCRPLDPLDFCALWFRGCGITGSKYIRHSFHAYFFLGVHVDMSARRATIKLSEPQSIVCRVSIFKL